MLDMNTDRAINAIGMLIIGALLLGAGILFFGPGGDNMFTQMVGGSEGHLITYNLEGGSGDFPREVVDYENNAYQIPNNEPTRSSYLFEGWTNTSDDEDTRTYYPGDQLTVEDDMAFQAEWQASSHDIVFDLNGGYGNFPSVKSPFGEDYVVPEDLPTNEGQHLLHWVSDHDDEAYAPGETINIDHNNVNGPITLTAVWAINEYDVNYDLDGGEADESLETDESYEHNQRFVLSDVQPTREGYNFHGWMNSATGETHDPGSSFLVQDDTTLTAAWNASNHRIQYNLDGGAYTGAESPALMQYGNHGEEHTTPTTMPTKAGFVFNGWNNSRDDRTYQAGSSFDIEGDTTLTANWTLDSYFVDFNLMNGTGVYPREAVDHNEDFELPNHAPTRYGYTFTGWMSSQDNQVYQPADTITIHEDTTLSAQWVTDQYAVIFELNGGSGTFTDDMANYGSNYYITERIPTMDGESFQGWLSSSDNQIYQPGEEVLIEGTTTLTAQWSTNDYTVSYDVGEGSGSYNDVPMSHGQDHIVSSVEPTRSGYDFDGWLNNQDDNIYQTGETFSVTNDTKLTAQWSLSQYDVNYLLNGGQGSHSTEQGRHGEGYQVNSEAPTRDGYTFVGWRNSQDGQLYNGGSTFTLTEPVDLTAEWLMDTFDVVYDLNDGSGSDAFTETYGVIHNATHSILDEEPTRVGYNFNGWLNSTDGFMYDVGQDIKVDANTTLTAQWSLGDYTLDYDLNGGSVDDESSLDTQTYTHLDTLRLSKQVPVLEDNPNVTFQGWKDSQDGTMYDAGEYYTMIEDATLVAQWGYDSHTISYDENGGSIDYNNGFDDETDHIFDADTETGHEVIHAPTRGAYTFVGWESDVDGTVYQPGDTLIPTKDTTLTAVWNLNEYALTYNLNKGSGSFPKETVIHGEPFNISGSRPTRTGYTFNGWVRSDNGSTVQANSWITITSNVELEAKWTANAHTVSFASSTIDNSSRFNNIGVRYDESFTIPSTLPSRNGYEFTGWTNSRDEKTYQPGDSFRITGDTTLTPQWKNVTMNITFDQKGGSGGPSNTKALFGNNFLISGSTPVKNGYVFSGWYNSQDKKTYQAGESFKVSGNTTLTAQWSVGEFFVTYDNNGGVGTTPAAKEYSFESSVPLRGISLTKKGYSLVGFKRSDTGAVLKSGDSFKMPGESVELTAQWKINSYTVSYDLNGGSGSFANATHNYGSNHTVRSGTPTKSGYVFDGWTRSDNNKRVTAGTKINIAGALTLKARWTPEKYTIEYNANGGSGGPGRQAKTYGQALNITQSAPSRSGYRFTGWTVNRNGSGTVYQPGDNYTREGNTTLYAQWVERVRYRLNLGSMKQSGHQKSNWYGFGGVSGFNLVKGTDYVWETKGHVNQQAINDGKTFAAYLYVDGWGHPSAINHHRTTSSKYITRQYTAPVSGAYHTRGYLHPSGGSRSGRAVWENANLFLQHPERNKGTSSGSSNGDTYVDKGTTIRLPEPNMSKTNYEFAGWKNGSTVYQPGDSVTITKPDERTQFTAQWKPKTYRVQYKNGSGGPSDMSAKYGSTFRINKSSIPRLDGHVFAGWINNQNGNVYNPNSTFTINGPTTLTARFRGDGKLEVGSKIKIRSGAKYVSNAVGERGKIIPDSHTIHRVSYVQNLGSHGSNSVTFGDSMGSNATGAVHINDVILQDPDVSIMSLRTPMTLMHTNPLEPFEVSTFNQTAPLDDNL